MTPAEGELTDRIARGEAVEGGPGACTRPGCAHGRVWHSSSNRQHPCERCECPGYQAAVSSAAARLRTELADRIAQTEGGPVPVRRPLPNLDEADQPALDGLEPPAEPEQLTFEAAAGTLTPEALDQAAVTVLRTVAAAAVLPDDRALLEAAAAAWTAVTGDDEDLLELLDAGAGLADFWRAIDSVCVCFSCNGMCGGSGHPGWCGRVALVDGRPICEGCREQADVFDSHRAAISLRIVDGEHIALVADPFETYRKVTVRLSPREARHLAELLNKKAEKLEIHMRPLIGRTRADLEALCQAGNPDALAEWEAREQ